jgi:hypothetical protein
MRIVFEILLALVIAGVIAVLIHTARHLLSTPVPETAGAELFTVIAAAGDAEELEQTVSGILWLSNSGTMRCKIIIADCGLTPDSRQVAALLTKDNANVTICQPESLTALLCPQCSDSVGKECV